MLLKPMNVFDLLGLREKFLIEIFNIVSFILYVGINENCICVSAVLS